MKQVGYKAWNNYEEDNRKREKEEFKALPLAGKLWVYARGALALTAVAACLYFLFVR